MSSGKELILFQRQLGQPPEAITSDMLIKARRNAGKGNFSNVEFRLSELEHLPLADASVAVIIPTASSIFPQTNRKFFGKPSWCSNRAGGFAFPM